MDTPTSNGLPVGGPVAEDNIINRRGGESIYQSCVNLKLRLAEVPGFEQHLEEMEAEERATADPVNSLWTCLRAGYPLITIFNASQPDEMLEIDPDKVPEAKRPKAATFKFLQACLQDMGFPQQDCFLITDLYGENTTGFIKVIKMVNRVLDILEMQGRLRRPSAAVSSLQEGPEGTVKLTKRQHILKELLVTERDYVHHLQNLQALKKELEETGALTGDSSHQIFMNLNDLLDSAQRFLIRMEQHYALPEERQDWGHLFIDNEEFLRRYEPFISNQLQCDEVCLREWDKIKSAPRSIDLQQMVAMPATLNSFFVKPFQRLTKYPLMLGELRKQTDNEALKTRITMAIDMIQSVLDSANDAIDKEHLQAAMIDLANRVDDWKALKVDGFGDLLRFGTFTVLKGEGNKDSEREYHIYLFQRILLCCKDINPNKQKSKLIGSKDKPSANLKGKPRLQLKGRIYMANVTDVVLLQKPGSYRIQIFWKGDPGVVDNFIIRYVNEDIMKKWYTDIDKLRVESYNSRHARNTGTSDSEFTYMQNMAGMVNPYQQEYEAEEPVHVQSASFSEFPVSRNASSTSLRARSATGGSSGSIGLPAARPPPRFPLPEVPPLLQTQLSNGSLSPGERVVGTSYFSPVTETPSTRSSSQSTFNYPRQMTPTNAWNEESNRTSNGANGRVQRPSLPPMPGSGQTSSQMSQRMRSASSPDIHNTPRYMNGHAMQTIDNVPVPPIPPQLQSMRAPVNRSQNNSPTNNGLPIRTMAQTPLGTSRHMQGDYSDGYFPAMANSQSSLSEHPLSMSGTLEPDTQASQEPIMPTQLKAKVNFDDNYVTLVIASNILFRSLTDRVDAKLARFTNRSIGSRSVRLRYKDEDGDFITIDSDEAVQLAFMEWRDQHQDSLAQGQVGEIQLFCQAVEN
ncbi:Rho guanyl nucleotide exchange factor, putative [Talaromyces stipitatus ATCC 10500]|uniref:Rho guanyl nucleotide exchange factor, putative n=1 Tax=Talaromyces stipitatus (strain ATCC 10500 / CBS 375.48 / QM 6759 / NRRL 1006) TaxID=441959 RepID=B8LVY1_TALSN|nr:Rho guanyl nucleotide exchange factor, putative [Talaromyces stipitatus ATCC 10500]EED24347.1 Rho guanyl nucleotide exchange factor, putative [Talaromyces stipitatus ATCC 10500]